MTKKKAVKKATKEVRKAVKTAAKEVNKALKNPAVKKAIAKANKPKKATPKKTAKKPIKKADKPVQKKTAKATSQKKAFKRAETKSPKKSGGSNAKKKDKSHIGEVHRGKTKYIDKETKPERNYVVVVDDGKAVTVAKLKSIKIFDAKGRNADKALVEINATRYGLEKRTGVDFQKFDKNRMSGKSLTLEDKQVFPEGKERFKLGSHDTHRALNHTNSIPKDKKKR